MTRRVAVQLINLGRMGYSKALEMQNEYANQHLRKMEANRVNMQNSQVKGQANLTLGQDVLLLVEHDPVFTVGIRKHNYDESFGIKLKKTGAEYYRTNRGGLVTFHGPGQLVAYPIINLKNFKLGMRAYIEKLEQTVIRTCGYFGIKANTSPCTGVWVLDKKICAMGVHGSRYITTHGLGLNCCTDLRWFEHIVPCGIEGKGVTSISEELKRKVTIDECTDLFVKAFEQEFDCDINKGNQEIIE